MGVVVEQATEALGATAPMRAVAPDVAATGTASETTRAATAMPKVAAHLVDLVSIETEYELNAIPRQGWTTVVPCGGGHERRRPGAWRAPRRLALPRVR